LVLGFAVGAVWVLRTTRPQRPSSDESLSFQTTSNDLSTDGGE